MIFRNITKIASAGTNEIPISLPAGVNLKHLAARNETKGWQITILALSEAPDRNHRYFSLVGRVSQPGVNRHVIWEGEIRIDPPFLYVLGVFVGADADDVLVLTVGYEMPAPRRGWW